MQILLTHALSYAGPGAFSVLTQTDATIYCHDPVFVDNNAVADFQSKWPGCVAMPAQTPTEIFNFLKSNNVSLDAVIHNNVLGNKPTAIENIPKTDFLESFNELYLFPVELTQLLIPHFKDQQKGSFIFVTSARYLMPESGYALATSIRSATTSFALALSVELAKSNIQVNVVAPNYLYSEAYYPKAKFIDSAEGRDFIKEQVPLGRLGNPEEIGELLAFLVLGKSSFVTGQVIDFTGGWPNR